VLKLHTCRLVVTEGSVVAIVTLVIAAVIFCFYGV